MPMTWSEYATAMAAEAEQKKRQQQAESLPANVLPYSSLYAAELARNQAAQANLTAPPTQADITAVNQGQAISPQQPARRSVSTMSSVPPYERDIEALIGQIAGRGADAAARRQGVIDALQQQIAAQGQFSPQLDLSPLMALSDTWFGGNLSKGYARPKSARDQMEAIQALEMAIQKQKLGLSEDELNYLKEQLGGKEKLAGLANQREMAILRRREVNAQEDAVKDYKDEKMTIDARKDFVNRFSGTLDQLSTFSQSLNKAKALISKNGGEIPSPLSPEGKELESAVSTMLTAYNSGVAKLGALAGADLEILQKGTGLGLGINQYMSAQVKGGGKTVLKLLDEFNQTGDKIMTSAKGKVNKAYNGRADELFDEYHREYKTRSAMGKGFGTSLPPTDFDPNTASREQLLQYLGE